MRRLPPWIVAPAVLAVAVGAIVHWRGHESFSAAAHPPEQMRRADQSVIASELILDLSGNLWLNRKPIEGGNLRNELTRLECKHILVKASPKISYRTLQMLEEEARNAGCHVSLGILTDELTNPGKPLPQIIFCGTEDPS